ncbi:Dihydropteroate synthase [Paenibacillus sp. CECT 9249]|uniref:dihydropteroate synthase n=1 Tax=Paenibacillus sp. CECT 9249 TaxID=2845385 RepID=UPI001E2C854D|nr:dihydropteroate synthase [Paenibacillus sp. CECT 9249]CAH0121548.1 Dihydropteroate synthase [Paenibacillus sp. CECT 9249]
MLKPTIHHRRYRYGGASIELGARTLVMGILNVTPDSFSDGGQYNDIERAVERAKAMVAEGADMIDIGGESTRPGSEEVGMSEELERVVPIVQALQAAMPGVPLSVDTYKAEVARQSLAAGAHIINDIWGFKRDPDMAAVAAEAGCPVILMHNRDNRDYADYVCDVLNDLRESVRIALAAGVEERNIILDPGVGFAKDYGKDLTIMHHLDEVAALGYPVLLGTSRKRFIRNTLHLEVNDVVEGTAATVALGIAQGCQIVRVHDVREIKRTVRMCDAILYGSGGKHDG